MTLNLGETRLEAVQGDITQQEIDAVVNAANSALAGGGGVDGAIHRAGGASILAECRQFKGGCPTGQARITGAGDLRAKKIIHAVGPVWNGGGHGESELLCSAYRSSLQLAVENELRSIAFPSISTGAYRFPLEKASRIAVDACKDFCSENPGALDLIRFVCFSARDLKVYGKLLNPL